MTSLIVTGASAGAVLGYVFQRADLCFHSAWSGVFDRRFHLLKTWLLGVAIGAVGLSAVYGLDRWELNEGLGLRLRGNVTGGLLIGIGMVVAASCVSGLFYKLGSGMLGALVGLGSWFFADALAARWLVGRDGVVDLRGPATDLGDGPTVPEVVGIDRWIVAIVFLVVVAVVLSRTRRDTAHGVQWSWPFAGVVLGVATTGAWALAGAGGATFGPSTVGGPDSLVDGGAVNVWLVSFLGALVVGAVLAAWRSDTLWVRGERSVRYAQLAVGGALLGAGGQVGGGCNLGHGLSGTSQMNVSSWLTVGAIVAGIYAARAVSSLAGRPRAVEWRIHETTSA